MRRLFLIFLLTAAAFGQSTLTVFPIPDLTMTGSRVQLAASGVARYCQVTALSSNSDGIRWGDSTTTSTRGANIAPGGAQFLPPSPAPAPGAGTMTFALSSVYFVGTSGDTLTGTCVR
jgi:hypothetical protein